MSGCRGVTWSTRGHSPGSIGRAQRVAWLPGAIHRSEIEIENNARKCRSRGTLKIRRAGPELVGPQGSLQTAARLESAALQLRRADCATRAKPSAGCRLR